MAVDHRVAGEDGLGPRERRVVGPRQRRRGEGSQHGRQCAPHEPRHGPLLARESADYVTPRPGPALSLEHSPWLERLNTGRRCPGGCAPSRVQSAGRRGGTSWRSRPHDERARAAAARPRGGGAGAALRGLRDGPARGRAAPQRAPGAAAAAAVQGALAARGPRRGRRHARGDPVGGVAGRHLRRLRAVAQLLHPPDPRRARRQRALAALRGDAAAPRLPLGGRAGRAGDGGAGAARLAEGRAGRASGRDGARARKPEPVPHTELPPRGAPEHDSLARLRDGGRSGAVVLVAALVLATGGVARPAPRGATRAAVVPEAHVPPRPRELRALRARRAGRASAPRGTGSRSGCTWRARTRATSARSRWAGRSWAPRAAARSPTWTTASSLARRSRAGRRRSS